MVNYFWLGFIFSLKRTRKKYSFDKGGAKVAPLVIALVLLVVLAGDMGVNVYQLSVVRIQEFVSIKNYNNNYYN